MADDCTCGVRDEPHPMGETPCLFINTSVYDREGTLVRGLRKAVKDDETEWIDANIVRLLLDRYDNPHPPGKGRQDEDGSTDD